MKNLQKNNLEYQKRIYKALIYIRDNLDKPLSLEEVSGSACFSKYHFHRIFSDFMKETLGEYTTRKKLERAAIKLAYSPSLKISNIAFEYGYSSVSNFSKAFNQWFGCRPTQITKRKQNLSSGNGKLQTKYEKPINSKELFISPPQENWRNKLKAIDDRVCVKSTSALDVYYLISPGGYEFSSVARTWKKLIESLDDKNIDIDECERFALCHDHPGLTPPSKCRYDACVVLPQNWDGELTLARTKIPSGRYAIFSVEGTKESILDQYLEFFTVWVPQSGYELDDFPAIDRYISPFTQTDIKVELWVKIKRLSLT